MFGFGYGRSFSLGRISLVADIYKGILDLYPGAAAAYSLRWLNTSYTGSAVEVSRDVDTQVQDIGFTANGSLDSTALLEFATNSSQSLLDYATGSAAAYSLRKVTSDSPVTTLPANFGSGAVAAYSLRKVNANYTGSAIEVRRSSDNTTQDIGFDANGDLDTTALTNFVNEETNAYTSDFSSTEDLGEFNGTGSAAQSIGGVDDAYKFTLSGGNVVHFVTLYLPEFNQTYSVTLDYYIPSGQTVTDIEASLGSTSQHTLDVTGAWTTETFTFVASDDSSPNNRRLRFVTNAYTNVNADGDVFYFKNIVVTQTTADGHVRTWYDQSGNTNNALNGTDTEQPLIVNSGSLVTENGKASIHFGYDGSTPNFLTNSTISKSGDIDTAIFSVHISLGGSGNYIYDGFNSPDYFGHNNASRGVIFNYSSQLPDNVHQLISRIGEVGGLLSVYKNGLLHDSGSGGIVGDDGITIGTTRSTTIYQNSKQQEIIIFDSDQSTNRKDIEWNINNYYNIYPQWDRQSAIEVRRSSDDAVQDIGFDANGDLDTGSLDTFVNEETVFLHDTFDGAYSYTAAIGNAAVTGSVLNFPDTTNKVVFTTLTNTLKTQQVRVTFTILNYVSGGIKFENYNSGAQGTTRSANGTYVEVLTIASSGNNNFGFSGTMQGQIDNFKIEQLTADGHVRTWYDQSGNHVTASNGTDTEQPLIVEAGTVVTQSNRPAIKFDGADDYFTASNLLTELDNSDFLISVVYENEFSAGSKVSVPRLYLRHSAWSYNTFDTMTWSPLTGQSLLSFQVDGATQEVFGNGTSLATASQAQQDFTPTDFLIGRYATTGWMDGKMQELIVFNSNQSSNRLGIESNINAYYDIYTNPSASAYVRTWYDQSGNTNDAVQTSESARPKIVNTGSLVVENGKLAIQFDGANDWLSGSLTNSQFSQVFVVKNTTGTGTAIGYSGAVTLQSLYYNTQDDDITFSSGSGLYTIDNINVKGYLNGVDETGAATTFTQTFNRLYFGSTNGSISFIDGKIQEYIHFPYASDQSANRPFIERLINNQFNIFTEAAPTITGAPTISGDVQLGSTLTASTSATVTGTPTPVTTWRWERSTNGTSGWTAIIGETTTTYDIQDGDLGYYLRVVQIESNGVGSATSPSTSTDVVRTVSGAFVARVVADGGTVENESAGTTQVEYLSNNP